MSRRLLPASLAAAGVAAMLATLAAQTLNLTQGVKITPNDAERRVDITIDGKPFTSYIYPTTIKKPVLWPLRTATGTVVTRRFPLEAGKGERVDHPHHVGLWFNHGDVNGFDFWNNSEAIKPDEAKKYGTIVHKKIGEVKSAPGGPGELNVEMEWIGGDGVALLRENTKFVFGGGKDIRTIDRITTLTALGKDVVFRDNKEGVLGIRVTRALEHPTDKPDVFTDASGRSTGVPVLDNSGVTGKYTTSEGKTGDAAWGTRGKWTMLTGTVESEPVTLAILDHPKNPGYPTYWHARGYGLFSANMLGAKVFNPKEELNFAIPAGKSATFRYRILILSGTAKPQDLEAQHKIFTSGS